MPIYTANAREVNTHSVMDALSTMLRLLRGESEEASWLI